MSNKICKCGHYENEHEGMVDYPSACFHRGEESIYCPCMGFFEDVEATTQAHLRQVEANYDALQSPMPCGHLARYAVNGEDGTQYCCVCAANALETELEKYKNFFDEVEWCGDQNKCVCPDCGNYQEQGHRLSCRYRIFRGEQ